MFGRIKAIVGTIQTSDLDAALVALNGLVDSGVEYPDAHSAVCSAFGLTSRANVFGAPDFLTQMYDEQ